MPSYRSRSEIEAAGFERYTDQPVAVGDTVVIHARGWWRSATVTKVTAKYVYADVTTPTSPDLHTVGRGDRTGRMADLYVARSREVSGFFVQPR